MSKFKIQLRKKLDPDPRVIKNCVNYFSARLMIACESMDDSLTLYRDAKNIPNTTTISAVHSALNLVISEPISLEFPSLVAGTENSGRQVVVKLLRPAESDDRFNCAADKGDARLAESRTVQVLGLDTINPDDHAPQYCFVPTRAEVVTVQHKTQAIQRDEEYHVLIMKRFVSAVSCAPHFSSQIILENAEERILPAIERMHQLGYVHMDIKTSNIFVDGRGKWWLGDFGSMRREGEDVYSTTRSSYCRDLLQGDTRADRRFDYFMFAVALCLASLERGMSAGVLIWRDGFANRALLDNHVAWMQETHHDVYLQRLGAFVQALLVRHDGPINQVVMEDDVPVKQNEIEVDQGATKGKRGAIHFLTKRIFGPGK